MSTISVLNKQWEGLTVDMTGPDGSEIIGRLVFLNCPVCHGVVAPTYEQEDGSVRDFATDHAANHIKQAQDWDNVNRLIEILTKDAEAQQATT